MHKNQIEGSILLIEDSLPLATLYSEYLQGQGHRVVHAENGQDGLVALGEEQFDLLLLDLTLPDMHGFDVLRYLKKKTIDVPVVVVYCE